MLNRIENIAEGIGRAAKRIWKAYVPFAIVMFIPVAVGLTIVSINISKVTKQRDDAFARAETAIKIAAGACTAKDSLITQYREVVQYNAELREANLLLTYAVYSYIPEKAYNTATYEIASAIMNQMQPLDDVPEAVYHKESTGEIK